MPSTSVAQRRAARARIRQKYSSWRKDPAKRAERLRRAVVKENLIRQRSNKK